ncbi:MAG: tetratricopeptide repeat protein [Planctomycetota bacterium]
MAQPHTQNKLSGLAAGLRRPSPGMFVFCTGLAVVLFCGIVFSPVLTAGFVNQDDRLYVYGVGRIWSTTWSEALATFGRVHYPNETGGYFQPVTALSFMLDAWLTARFKSPTTFQFHATNVMLHLFNVGLLFVLLRRFSGSVLWSALPAMVFGLHPVQVEPVAWVAQRMTLLGTFFSLSAMYCYVRYGRSQRFMWMTCVTLLFGAACLSKPVFVGLPVVLLILDIWPLNRGRMPRDVGKPQTQAGTNPPPGCSPWKLLIEKVPLFVLMAACIAKQLWVHAHVQQTPTVSISATEVVAQNLVSFVARIFWPVDLTPYYPFSQGIAGVVGSILGGVLALLALGTLAVVLFRLSRPLFAAAAGATVMVFPALLDVSFAAQLLGDQCLYAALVVPALAAGVWLGSWREPLRRASGRIVATGLMALAMILAAQSHLQAYLWQDGETLYRYTIKHYPKWVPGYVEIIRSYLRQGDLDSALFYAEKAADVAPEDPSTQFYLGHVMLRHPSGRSHEAIAPLRRALASDPDWIDCLQDLGVALARTGQTEEAIVHLEHARDLRPRSADIHLGLGHAYLDVGRPSSARREFQLSLEAQSSPLAHLGLARAWAANDQPEIARKHLATALALDPSIQPRAALAPELTHLRDEPGFEALREETPAARTDVQSERTTATSGPAAAQG